MYSADVIQLIINALVNVVWYKRDFYRILDTCGVPQHIIDNAVNNAGGYKAPKLYVADSLTRQLNRMGEEGLGPLRRIIQQLINWRDFSSVADERQARNAIERLKKVVGEADRETIEAREKREIERKRRQEELLEKTKKSSMLAELREQYYGMISSTEPQKRGYALEAVLYNLFKLFNLNPSPPFKIPGEQIDGSFTLHDDDFLLEAQWEKDKPTAEELYAFQGKVARKYQGTRGIFISIEGFSKTSLQAFEMGMAPNILLLDGEDLVYVLEERIDLDTLISEKRKHASRTGEVYCKVRFILGETI